MNPRRLSPRITTGGELAARVLGLDTSPSGERTAGRCGSAHALSASGPVRPRSSELRLGGLQFLPQKRPVRLETRKKCDMPRFHAPGVASIVQLPANQVEVPPRWVNHAQLSGPQPQEGDGHLGRPVVPLPPAERS